MECFINISRTHIKILLHQSPHLACHVSKLMLPMAFPVILPSLEDECLLSLEEITVTSASEGDKK